MAMALSRKQLIDTQMSPGTYRWWGYAGTFFWIDPTADLIGMAWTPSMPGRAYPVELDFLRLGYDAIVH
jgi:CubicO group peptidase (beta-lactamase class C family)